MVGADPGILRKSRRLPAMCPPRADRRKSRNTLKIRGKSINARMLTPKSIIHSELNPVKCVILLMGRRHFLPSSGEPQVQPVSAGCCLLDRGGSK